MRSTALYRSGKRKTKHNSMPKTGHRFPLIVYTHMLNRWWPALLSLALALFALAYGVSRTPEGQAEPSIIIPVAGLGIVVLIVAVFIITIRKSAYVQPFHNHLRVVTPFLRLNISYRRFRSSTTSEMQALFPPANISGWKNGILAPLASMTAIVINLNAHPLHPFLLRWFLSPFFFKDNTPHLVILVKDWMRFSSEMESLRTGGEDESKPHPTDNSILARLSKK
jgi:hypothetical protein